MNATGRDGDVLAPSRVLEALSSGETRLTEDRGRPRLGGWLLLDSSGQVAAVASVAVTMRVFAQGNQGAKGYWHVLGESGEAAVAQAKSSVWWPLRHRLDGGWDAKSTPLLRRAIQHFSFNCPDCDECGALLQPSCAAAEAAGAAEDRAERAELLALFALFTDTAAAAVALCRNQGQRSGEAELTHRVQRFAARCLDEEVPNQEEDEARADSQRGMHRLLLPDDFPVLLQFPVAVAVLSGMPEVKPADPPLVPSRVNAVLRRELHRRCHLLGIARGSEPRLLAESGAKRARNQPRPLADSSRRAAAVVLRFLERPGPDFFCKIEGDELRWDELEEASAVPSTPLDRYFASQPPDAAGLASLCPLRDDFTKAEPLRGRQLPILIDEGLPGYVRACLPEGFRYMRGVLSEGEEQATLKAIRESEWAPNVTEHERMTRRVQHYGYRFKYPSGGMDLEHPIEEGLPAWAEPIARRLEGIMGLSPMLLSQLTVNEYKPGQGIAPHVDCLKTIGTPLITVSLGAAVPMSFAHPPTGRRLEIVLERGSACVMTEASRTEWTHSIAKRVSDPGCDGKPVRRGMRVSLTFRVVPPLQP
eukprot:Hpha_TRINITY_DN223_c0_g1::TRINITY_DN223_c0_g1_i1::g.83775::m.83775/K10770/ALKBH8; alkylated DNA repair protein alkB homolog 8